MAPGPENIGWIRQKKAEGHESQEKEREQNPTPESADSFLARKLQQGRESRVRRNINLQRETERKTRQEKAGKGMWGASGAALGLVAVGIPLATGQILKYSLLGWKIGPNGMPQIDKESLANFDTAYRWASGTKKS